ncbi:hypothetical protein HDU90_001227 [Geranomyces variabilis]|nr:hypothetical protein HDU90_001227 [Geranomyces variabilis]
MTSSGYRVFSLCVAGTDVPLAHVRLQIAARLGLDPNSPLADLLDVYRVDEDLRDDDPRLHRRATSSSSSSSSAHADPSAVFALTMLPETMQPLAQWIPNISKSSLHILVRLPAASRQEQQREERTPPSANEGLPPAYAPVVVEEDDEEPAAAAAVIAPAIITPVDDLDGQQIPSLSQTSSDDDNKTPAQVHGLIMPSWAAPNLPNATTVAAAAPFGYCAHKLPAEFYALNKEIVSIPGCGAVV